MPSDRRAILPALLLLALWTAPARADSVSLTWTAPGDDGNTGTASAYEMRFSQVPVSSDTASWWAAATSVGPMPAPLRAGSPESFVVAGLAPSTTYYFAIRTRDDASNVSGYSNVAIKPSGNGVVLPTTPSNFAASVTFGAVLLTWTAVPPGGPELGYRLNRWTGTGSVPSLLATLPLTATAWNDSTIAAGAHYDYTLTTYTDTGESAPARVSVSIPGGSPPPPPPAAAATGERVHGYPNPARDQVTFRLHVDAASSTGNTRVTIFDLTGHRITVLADETFPEGEHAIPWACRSDQGTHVAPGLYNVIVEGPAGRTVTRIAIVP